MSDQRNLFLAIAISLAILIGFQVFVEGPRLERVRAQQAAEQAMQAQQPAADAAASPQTAAPGAVGDATGNANVAAAPEAASPSAAPQAAAPGSSPTNGAPVTRADALGATARIKLSTDSLHGSVALQGPLLDDLTLANYYQTVERKEEVLLLSPLAGERAYYANFGWLSSDQGVRTPSNDSRWAAKGTQLGVGQNLVLTWDNGAGLTFERTVSIDDDYMFTVVDRVTNNTGAAINLQHYGLVARHEQPKTAGFFILHEGPIGVLDGALQELGYNDLVEDGPQSFTSTGGWLGFTDKYWAVTVIPGQDEQVQARYRFTQTRTGPLYQADYVGPARTIQPGETIEATGRVFAGAKEVRLLDRYANELKIPLFDRAVDFGWFYFLTKPFFYILNWLGSTVGNFGVAILIFTVMLRLAMFPLANKSFKEMTRLKLLQPKMQELQERYKDDRTKMQQELMGLYKKEKVNPLAGCLPVLVQIPIFFALYKVLFVSIEMRHQPFFGWINDLSAPDPTSLFNLFGLIPWNPPALLMVGIWPILMGLTMWLQQKLNPAPTDPIQAKVLSFLPLIFTFMLAPFAAGLVIYWTWNNILSIAQQWVIMRRMGAKVS
jgi:YidC/Oxa1 family membrane protein insertase